MSTSNILNHAINGSVRIALVIMPAFKAGTYMLALASKVLDGATPKMFKFDSKPQAGQDKSMATKVYEKLHGFLPEGVKNQGDAFSGMSTPNLIKGALFYTATAVVSTFVLNKLIGPAPEIYNTVAKYVGSPIRLDTKYDVIQLAVDYVTKKA